MHVTSVGTDKEEAEKTPIWNTQVRYCLEPDRDTGNNCSSGGSLSSFEFLARFKELPHHRNAETGDTVYLTNSAHGLMGKPKVEKLVPPEPWGDVDREAIRLVLLKYEALRQLGSSFSVPEQMVAEAQALV